MEKQKEDLSALIELYALGELDEDKIPVIDEYLRNNPSALREVEDIRKIVSTTGRQIQEPPISVVDSTKSAVHSLMERDSRRVIIPFFNQIGRFVAKPAFTAAAALITITVCLFLIFMPNKPEQFVNQPEGTGEIKKTGIAATENVDYDKYVKHSADIFSQILEQNQDDFRKSLDTRQIVIEIGNAMYLLEKYEDMRMEPDFISLLTDIKEIWQSIKDFAENKEGVTFEVIKNSIIDKDVIERVRWYEPIE